MFCVRAAALLVVCLAAGACSKSGEAPAPRGGGAIPVTVAAAQEKSVPVQLRAIGNVQPTESVTVRSRVGGTLQEIHFREGQDVKEGDLLFTIDARPLEAELRQAEANLMKDAAELENARREAARYEELFRKGFVAQSQYDQIRTRAASLEGTVRADRAAVQNARVQAGYATIRSPKTGRTGAVQVHEGDLIAQNQTPMVVINDLAPIEVAFAMPERELPGIQRYRAQSKLGVDAVLPQRNERIAQGQLTFIDNRVDPATGTIQLKATFANDPIVLWPGQFVNVVVSLSMEPNAIVVPSAAVQAGQQGNYVFAVKQDQSVEMRPVTVERTRGPESVVSTGLRAGETVVTDGQLRLVPGARITVKSGSVPQVGQ